MKQVTNDLLWAYRNSPCESHCVIELRDHLKEVHYNKISQLEILSGNCVCLTEVTVENTVQF